jgi:hypothetical protein
MARLNAGFAPRAEEPLGTDKWTEKPLEERQAWLQQSYGGTVPDYDETKLREQADAAAKDERLAQFDLPSLPRTVAGDLVRAGFATSSSVGEFLVGLVPYSRWATDWEKQSTEFMQLTEKHGPELGKQLQVRSLLWDSFGAAAWVAPNAAINIWKAGAPIAGKAIGKSVEGFGALAAKPFVWAGEKMRAAKIARYQTPLEDITKWPEANYWKELGRTLKERNLAPDEIDSVAKFLTGDQQALTKMMFRKGGPSKAFAEMLRVEKGNKLASMKTRVGLRESSFEELTPQVLRKREFLRAYKESVYESVGMGGSKMTRDIAKKVDSLYERALPRVIEKIYGPEASIGKTLENASVEEIVAFRNFMQGNEGPALVKSINSTGPWSFFGRVSQIASRLEPLYKTFSNGTQRIIAGVDDSGLFRSQKIKLFDGMLMQSGFLKSASKKIGKGEKLVPTERLTARVQERTLAFFEEAKRLASEAKIENIPQIKDSLQAKLRDHYAKANPLQTVEDFAVRDLVDTITRFSDNLYADTAYTRLWEALTPRELTEAGKRGVELLMNQVAPKIQKAFATGSGLNVLEKQKALDEVLALTKKQVTDYGETWFKLGNDPKSQEIFWKRQFMRLRVGEGGNFPAYSPNILEHPKVNTARIFGILHRNSGKQKEAVEFYEGLERIGVRKRTLEGELIKAISQHANKIFLEPELRKAAATFSNAPANVTKYFEHFMARVMHLPSRADRWAAQVLEGTIGAVQRTVANSPASGLVKNKQGLYTSYDVQEATRFMSDLTYVAFLGFKPFSVMRNYVQPLMMVPTDLGGIKDLGLLGRAYKTLLSFSPEAKALRVELQRMGVIPEEFSGEFVGQTLKLFRKQGKLPSWDSLRDASLWMFGESHKHNCYMSGAAAIFKWDDAVKAVGMKNLKEFSRQAGLMGREPAIRHTIEDLIATGRPDAIREARAMFVRSVVTDTQFVYGVTETPLITQLGGGLGRQASIFQTFTLNYGSSIHKWLTTGTAEMKTARAINAFTSAALAYGVMRTIWEHDISLSTVGFGPFGSINMLREGPPIMRPIVQAMKTFAAIGGLAESNKPYSEKVKQEMIRLAWQGVTFTPGGLQMKQTIKRTLEEGPAGFAKSIIRYKKDNTKYL